MISAPDRAPQPGDLWTTTGTASFVTLAEVDDDTIWFRDLLGRTLRRDRAEFLARHELVVAVENRS